MAMKKNYLEDKSRCNVTFSLTKEAARSAKTVHIVGDFNSWDEKAMPMKKSKNGSFSITLDLAAGRDYQFRYLLDGKTWENDWEADKYIFSYFGACDNSVLVL
jgi:1,4-alpha-glucan branching enzyme